MIKSINIQYSKRDDLIAVQSEVFSLAPESVLVQVFTGVLDQAVIGQLLRELRELFPGVSVVGTSTGGEIMDAESVENSILVNFSLFEHSRVKSALVVQNDDLAKAGKELGSALRQEDARAAIVLGCGIKDKRTINGQPLLTAIHRELGDVIIAGGQAGDNGRGEITFVFTEEGITEHGVAAASIGGSRLVANNTYNLSWVPIGKKLTITDASGPLVYSIDDQSPYDIYKHYLGENVADGLPLSAADFPFIVERDGIEMAVHTMGVNDDGSFLYIQDFLPGEQLRFGFCHAGLLALGAQVTHDEIVRFNPQAVYIYSCVSRKWILGADISVELSSFADLAPSAGFFCYGEYYYYKTRKPYFFSQTMTVLCLTEKDEELVSMEGEDDYVPSMEESSQFKTLMALHRLVDTSTREIENMNRELAKLASKDSLTGLANRRLFDETLERELRRQQRAGARMPMSLLMMDIDYFKRFNDTYGHVSGDDCLRAVALVLGRNFKRPADTAARYGGEEFACILPSTDHEGAMALAETIRQGIEDLGIPHERSIVADSVTVSIGALTVESTEGLDSQSFLQACDDLLYQAKGEGRNRVVGKAVASLGK